MAAPRHPWRLTALVVTAIAGFGCNMLSLPFFLMTGMDPKHEPKCKLASDDKKKPEVRVVILASAGLETRPEFLRVDRELSSQLAKKLELGFKDNKEKVKVIPPARVEKYKDEHPQWRAMDAAEIGKHFDADYVIDLEIGDLSLYEPGSGNQLFRGHADIQISVVEVSKPDDEPMYKEAFRCEYPKTKGPLPASDGNPSQFRQEFVAQMAKELSWRFTAHPTSDDYSCTD
jgi:hypothetical protein